MSLSGVLNNIDWTTMFLLFWVLFGLLVYSVANILLVVNKKRQQITGESKNSVNDNSNCGDSAADNLEKSSVGSHVYSEKPVNRWWQLHLATGPDTNSVQWVNHTIQWIYSQDDQLIDSFLSVLLSALNNRHKKLSSDNGFTLEFIRLYRDQSFTPELSDITVEKESNENITVKSRISSPGIKFLIKAYKDKEEWIQYELTIDKLDGKLKTNCISDEELFVLRFVERPDFKASLKTLKSQQTKPENRVSEDAVIAAIVNTISSTVVDLCLSHHKDVPRLQRSDTPTIVGSDNSPKGETIERKLLVKVVEAIGLAQNKGSPEAYCVIEVDEPSQRSQTSTIKDTTHPVWNEHFIFNLKEQSSELLFEVYDKREDKFLGLGIVSVNELRANPSQNQVLVLQPGPLESDSISGSLAVEFLFMEHHSQSSQPSSPTSLHNSNQITLNKDIELIETNVDNEELIQSNGSEQLDTTDNTKKTLSALKETNSNSNMSSLIIQDFVCTQNPFIETKNNDTNYENNLHNSETMGTNPFIVGNQYIKLQRSVSCDNIRPLLPIIPPLVDISSLTVTPFRCPKHPSTQLTLRPDFKGNPFDGLKRYRKSFYDLPTQSISVHLNRLIDSRSVSDRPQPRLPPTTLFPRPIKSSDKRLFFAKSLNTLNGINSNPFLSLNPRISSVSSIDSVIGIESSDEKSDESSDNTITERNFTDNNRDNREETAEKVQRVGDNSRVFAKNKKQSNRSFKLFNKKLSLKQNKKSNSDRGLDRQRTQNSVRQNGSARNGMSGDGVLMPSALPGSDNVHALITNNNFVNQNELEFSLNESPNSEVNGNKSSLTIHSTQRASENGGSEGYGTGRGTPDSPSMNDSSLVSSSNSVGRSRSKESRSILKAIRKRFSFSNRSKSVEIRTDKGAQVGSRDSSVSSTSSGRARSVPGSREPSSPKEIIQKDKKNKTESNSNISEISGYSNRTFVHPKSILIVETKEDGLKHYVIPMSLANKNKWRRKGLKLHSFNDHLFVAKHLSGSITCQVCSKLFSKRPGKQGYQCRDCDYMCHKRCHIQVEVRCTKSTICSLKLEYVVDPKDPKTLTSIEVNDKPMADR